MNNEQKKLFGGTSKYYKNFRPNIPKKAIDIIIRELKITKKDNVLDIGCGTGQVARVMDGKCKELVCVDADQNMLQEARRTFKKTKSKIYWLNYNSKDLKQLKKKFNFFKAATICRAFHWMDQEQVLRDLDNLIEKDGGIAILGDSSFWNGKEDWMQAITKIVQKYLGKDRRAGSGKFKQSKEPWDKLFRHSQFPIVKQFEVKEKRVWTAKSIIGKLFSSSFAKPSYFGDKIEEFKKDVKRELLKLNPNDIFIENSCFYIFILLRIKS